MTYCHYLLAFDIHQTSVSHHRRHANELTSKDLLDRGSCATTHNAALERVVSMLILSSPC